MRIHIFTGSASCAKRLVRNQAVNAQNDTKALTSNGWATLRIESSSSAQSITIEVGGCRITVRADTDTELLAKICRVLKAI